MSAKPLRTYFFLLVLLAGCAGDEQRLSSSSPEALSAYAEGVHMTQQFYLTEARTAFERAIGHDSSFGMTWARLAIVEASAHDEVKAREHIALALVHSTAATRGEQFFIRMWERRISYDNETAAVLADSLISLHPENPETYLFRGQIHELFQHLDSALVLYHAASNLDTTFAPAAMTLGYAYSTMNDQQKALDYMARYIRLVPGAADPRASYADLLLRVGRYDEAVEQYRQSLNLKPDYWYAINQIGNVYRILGKLKAAGTQFDEGFRHMPQSEQLEAARMTAHAELNNRAGRHAEAITMYASALATDSTNLGAAYGLVTAYLESGNTALATAALDKAEAQLDRLNLLESQAMIGFHLVQAKLFIAKKDYAAARRACKQALETSTPLTRPAVFRHLAEIAIQEGDVEEALDACEEALHVNPNSPEALLTLTKAYATQGDARMTAEIGGRLLTLWKDADADFVQVKQLRQLLARSQSL